MFLKGLLSGDYVVVIYRSKIKYFHVVIYVMFLTGLLPGDYFEVIYCSKQSILCSDICNVFNGLTSG